MLRIWYQVEFLNLETSRWEEVSRFYAGHPFSQYTEEETRDRAFQFAGEIQFPRGGVEQKVRVLRVSSEEVTPTDGNPKAVPADPEWDSLRVAFGWDRVGTDHND